VILLDTDHLNILVAEPGERQDELNLKLRNSGEPVVAPIVAIEEQLRGWLAYINRFNDVGKQIPAYHRLIRLFQYFADWILVPFEERASDTFKELRKKRIRVGTQDLKIASIALVHNALLLSANLRDFRKVPGLRVQSWFD
jgi:tRNA(fMet)-specific endonuclease VapC